ncbi:MAG: hypothetical protein N2422_13365, partial [Rhodobacteraceae bacterium]|nr:hypothetical protein [Paracoccaceae bacterium]
RGGLTGNWLDIPGGDQQDVRLVCALDQMADDGNSSSGKVAASPISYTPSVDCWALSGLVDAHLAILP